MDTEEKRQAVRETVVDFLQGFITRAEFRERMEPLIMPSGWRFPVYREQSFVRPAVVRGGKSEAQ